MGEMPIDTNTAAVSYGSRYPSVDRLPCFNSPSLMSGILQGRSSGLACAGVSS